MAILIKTLAVGTIGTTEATLLYRSSNTPSPKATLVTSLRLVNTSEAEVTIQVYFVPKGTTIQQDALTNKRWIFPKGLKIPPGLAVIDDVELTLSAGDDPNNADAIYAQASTSNVLNYSVAGVEQEHD